MFLRKIVILFPVVILIVAFGCKSGVKRSEVNSVSEMSDTIKAVIKFNEYEHDFGIECINSGCTFKNNI